jgi:hypothetical protein
MTTSMSALDESPEPKTISRNGVICIFCGLPTQVVSSNPVFLLRCDACGKEAPYLAGDARVLSDLAST